MLTTEQREGMLQVISDLSKDARGYRVRYDYDAMSDDELEATWIGFEKEAEASQIRECEQKLVAQRRWESHIDSLISMGAKTRGNAIRWDMAAHKVEGNDAGYYCYLNGLAYELEHRIEEEMA